jgi:hypothetical protein
MRLTIASTYYQEYSNNVLLPTYVLQLHHGRKKTVSRRTLVPPFRMHAFFRGIVGRGNQELRVSMSAERA